MGILSIHLFLANFRCTILYKPEFYKHKNRIESLAVCLLLYNLAKKMSSMKPKRRYRKFDPQKAQIEALEQKSDRFRRIFSEYELISEELWHLQTCETTNVPDDFLDAVTVQTQYLEDEIGTWLIAPENTASASQTGPPAISS